MHFYMPTKVYSERGCVRRYSQEWATLGKKALIVTGKSSAKNGALMDVLGALHEHGTAVVVFDETEENPSIRDGDAGAGAWSAGERRFCHRNWRWISDGCGEGDCADAVS